MKKCHTSESVWQVSRHANMINGGEKSDKGETMNSSEILEREFLEMRARVLELAACLDRIDRAQGDVADSKKMIGIQKGIDILSDSEGDRAKRVQLLFSREYQQNWESEYELAPRF